MNAGVDIGHADIQRNNKKYGIDNIRRIWIIRQFVWIIQGP
jgi:hypothetical protein